MQHYIKTGEHTKGQPVHSIVASGPGPGVQHCSLEILQVQPVSLSAAAAAKWGPVAYESLLELHTGRTHQVTCLPLSDVFSLVDPLPASRSEFFYVPSERCR